MVEILRILLGVMVVASFGTIAAYLVVSVAVTASTMLGIVRRDRSADELDQVLAEILGRRMPERLAEKRRSPLSRRR